MKELQGNECSCWKSSWLGCAWGCLFMIRSDPLIFYSAGAFSGFPLPLYHWLYDCDCRERKKWDMGRDGGMAELEKAVRSHGLGHPKGGFGGAEVASASLSLHHHRCGAWVLWSCLCQKAPLFWGHASLSLHHAGVWSVCFPLFALSLKKMKFLQSHSTCVQGTETFSQFKKNMSQVRFLEEK